MRLSEIARLTGAQLSGHAEGEITGVAPIEQAKPGDLTFLANPRYARFVENTRATAIFVPPGQWKSPAVLLTVDNPYFAFTQVLQKLFPLALSQPEGVHPTAVLGENVCLGERVSIGAFVVVEDHVTLGEGTTLFPHCFVGRQSQIGRACTIYPNVSIREKTRIGDRVIIHSGTVIGSDGFGFAPKEGVYHKIPQIGVVVIEDDVEIGANCAIDRAALGETRIGRGTKLDNLIQVAHNVQIGENTVIAAQTGISGSTKIGRQVVIGGQVGFVGHITVGDKAMFGAQAGVTKSVPQGVVFSGYPAREHKHQLRIEASLQKLPDALKHLRELEKRLAELEKKSR